MTEYMWTKDDWNTPKEVLDRVRMISEIGYDPCPNSSSTVNAKTDAVDGLKESWVDKGLVFCNPPYSRGKLTQWAEKIELQAALDTEIVALVPCNVETRIWQEIFWWADALCFPDHRISFLRNGEKVGSSLGPTALVYFGKEARKFEEAFEDFGKVIVQC